MWVLTKKRGLSLFSLGNLNSMGIRSICRQRCAPFQCSSNEASERKTRSRFTLGYAPSVSVHRTQKSMDLQIKYCLLLIVMTSLLGTCARCCRLSATLYLTQDMTAWKVCSSERTLSSSEDTMSISCAAGSSRNSSLSITYTT